MNQICNWFSITPQAHYQAASRQQQTGQAEAELLKMVRTIRSRHPRMGARKMLRKVHLLLAEKGISIGRDRFLNLLARHDLLVPPLRRQRRTTWSGLWRCPNRLAGLAVTRAQQVWVCDITYLETEQDFCYLALVTDAFSRYIVGHDVCTTLAVEGARRALDMAIAQAQLPLGGLIHHSDHGVQYTCHAYRDRLAAVGILSSMGEVGNCYDNPQAERVNGILKIEYGLGDLLLDTTHAQSATTEAVWLYNHDRPHLALGYEMPVNAHRHKVDIRTVN